MRRLLSPFLHVWKWLSPAGLVWYPFGDEGPEMCKLRRGIASQPGEWSAYECSSFLHVLPNSYCGGEVLSGWGLAYVGPKFMQSAVASVKFCGCEPFG